MLRLSRISVPPGVGTNVAWWRDASTSGMTMSLSVARPILIEPAGTSAGRPGRRILSMLVARLPSLERGAAVGPIARDRFQTGGGDRLRHRGRPDGLRRARRIRRRAAWVGLRTRRVSRLLGRTGTSAAVGEACRRAAAGGWRWRRLARPGCAGPRRDRHRRGLRRRARRSLMPAHLERQPRTVGIADVDLLAVGNVDRRARGGR